MGRSFKIAAVLFFVVAIGLGIAKPWRYLSGEKATKVSYVEKSYPVTEEKPFVVVVASYNNAGLYEKNLRSIFNQKYDNFRVVYVDDVSADGTYELVKAFSEKERMMDKMTLVRNTERKGPAENYYRAIHTLKDEEIAVIVDGDDWLSEDTVLQKLNQIYADPNVWLTYGSYYYYPNLNMGECAQKIPTKVIEENRFRTYTKKGFIASHLKTFYAGLFKKIKLQDFLYEENFLGYSWDVASMVPMIEMAGKHAKFVREILYINNRANPLNEDKVGFSFQQACDKKVRSLSRYRPLSSLDLHGFGELATDLVVFSYNRPLQLYALLESIALHAENLSQITVVARADEPFKSAYAKVERAFPDVRFVYQSKEPQNDFKPLVMEAVFGSKSPYVVFAVDDIVVKDRIDFKECAKAIKGSGAWGFYLRLGKNIDYSYMNNEQSGVPFLIDWQGSMFAWRFGKGKGDWAYANSLDMTVFDKQLIKKDLEKISFSNPNSFESAWQQRAKNDRVGLCFSSSKIVNIPLNLVNISSNRALHTYEVAELLEKFEQGLKMDIASLQVVDNRSPHIEYDPSFIPRPQSESFAFRLAHE